MIKSKAFALDVIRVCKELRAAKCESALINQFLRSGTSIGANIREAFFAHGKANFIAKLQIALKECSESEYWIELLIESGCTNTCTVNVTQKVNIKIPISYQVSACMGDPVIGCDGESPCCQ